jgi:hypothetical protein
LTVDPDFFERFRDGPVLRPTSPRKTEFTDVQQFVEEPPEPVFGPGVYAERETKEPRSVRPPRQTDFVRLDADNRNLGRMGEEWVLEFEARRLTDAHQRSDLAKSIVWVSRDEGDGAGFDIRSFNSDASPRLIEVKTTGLAKYHPFYVSPNEVSVSRREADSYHLYRLFRFGRNPGLYILQGAISSTCRLEPAQYSARVAR